MNDCPLSLLRALINCESITPKSAGALDIIGGMLNDAGFVVEKMPSGEVDNLWAYYKSEKGGDDAMPKLLFAGHVDVVPPGDIDKWQSHPFAAEERDGYLFGRGAADMKSGVAAMVIAALRAAAGGYANGLALLLTSDEEGAATEGTAYVVKKLQERGVMIKRCIIGEPTCERYFGDIIKTGRRGSLTAEITIRGVQCHLAYPHRGENPIPSMLSALTQCQERFDNFADGDNQFPPTSFQIARIQSGIADNVIPPKARAVINFRYAPKTAHTKLQSATEEILQKHAPDKWQCQWHHGAKPFFTNKDAPLISALQTIIQKTAAIEKPPKTSTAGGTSDGRFLHEICEELAEFGVINTTIHKINESVKTKDIHLLTDIYTRAAQHFLAKT